jgi:NlpC/P60 family
MPPRHARLSHPDAARVASALALVVAASALCGTTPAAMHAQTAVTSPVRFGGFAARDESAASAIFGGVALSGHTGLLGLRVSGAIAGLSVGGDDRVSPVPVRSCSRTGCRNGYTNQYGSGSHFSTDAWSADADLIAEPFRTVPVLRQLMLGFSPYAFAGIGRFSTAASSTASGDTTRAIWSYGAGVHHDLVGRLALSGEARVRKSLDANTYIGGTLRNAVQYRIGLTVGMGGRPRREPPTPRVVWRGTTKGAAPVVKAPAPIAAPVPPAAITRNDGERPPSEVVPGVLDAAESQLNVQWRDGGATPDDGFDAGGFVQYVFAQEDIPLPRLVSELATTGAPVSMRVGALLAGDLLFFANDGTTADHVAIYVGHDRMVHSSASGGGVRYDVLGEGRRGAWFAEHLVGVRRILATRSGESRTPPRSLSPAGRPDGAPRPSGAP